MNNQFSHGGHGVPAWAGSRRRDCGYAVRLDNANALPHTHSRRKSSSRKPLDLRTKAGGITLNFGDPWSQVHFIILSEGQVNIFNLAKNAGTSVDQIERFLRTQPTLSKEMARNLQSFGSG